MNSFRILSIVVLSFTRIHSSPSIDEISNYIQNQNNHPDDLRNELKIREEIDHLYSKRKERSEDLKLSAEDKLKELSNIDSTIGDLKSSINEIRRSRDKKKLKIKIKTSDESLSHDYLSNFKPKKEHDEAFQYHINRLDNWCTDMKSKALSSALPDDKKTSIIKMIDEYRELEKEGIEYRIIDNSKFKQYIEQNAPDRKKDLIVAHNKERRSKHKIEREKYRKASSMRIEISNSLEPKEL